MAPPDFEMSNSSNSTTFSWNFSDKGLGTSMELDSSTDYSCADKFEREVCYIHTLRERLLEENRKKELVLKQIKPGNSFDDARLRAEKEILSTTLKSKLLLNGFRYIYETEEERLYSIGSVTLSNIKVHYNSAGSNKVRRYFLCALTQGSTLFLSQICEANDEGVVSFNFDHTFLNLPVDFKISIKIYILTVKQQSFGKKLLKKLAFWRRSRSEVEWSSWKRESLFKFWKEAEIDISNVNQTNEVFLELVNSKLCKVVIDVSATVDTSGFSHMGWLDVSRNGLFWNQRWCVLKGTELKCFNYPVDNFFNNPVTTIDLGSCVSAKIAGRLEESRTRVLMLEMDDKSNNPFCFYLSTNSNYEFNNWKILEKLVPTLQSWEKLDCLRDYCVL